jgi:hypothetical protein
VLRSSGTIRSARPPSSARVPQGWDRVGRSCGPVPADGPLGPDCRPHAHVHARAYVNERTHSHVCMLVHACTRAHARTYLHAHAHWHCTIEKMRRYATNCAASRCEARLPMGLDVQAARAAFRGGVSRSRRRGALMGEAENPNLLPAAATSEDPPVEASCGPRQPSRWNRSLFLLRVALRGSAASGVC